MHLQKSIEQLGYKPNETRIYIAALNSGEATISEIAQKAKIPRTTAQMLIQDLQKEGLMNFYIKKRRRLWLAENPEKLLIRLKEKEVFLKEVMPELQALRHNTGVKPAIKFYNGADGVKQILQDIIETKHHILSLTSLEDALLLLGEDFKDFIKQRYSRHLRVRFLTKRHPETVELKKRDAEELRQTRFLPENFELKNANFIYGNRIAIFSLNKKMPMGIIIEDQDIIRTQISLFELAWNSAKAD